MTVPFHIAEAAKAADIETVREWLATNDVNDVWDGIDPIFQPNSPLPRTLLLCVVDPHGASITAAHVDLARLLLARGADVNKRMDHWTALHYACRGYGGDNCVAMVSLLIEAGADVNFTRTGGYLFSRKTPLSVAIGNLKGRALPNESDEARRFTCRQVVTLLLASGASLDVTSYSWESHELALPHDHLRDVLNGIRQSHTGPRAVEETEGFEHVLACRDLIAGVRAAGSWRSFLDGPRKQLLVWRSLALRGCARPERWIVKSPTCRAMEFLTFAPNEIAWNILKYWRTAHDDIVSV